ncbi:MAG: Gfo/Idh/MocA family oxidoreductase [Bacteroidia bacterium]|nr:Gfo/Idh/MocA family oxidoreductase [Bacteroidia bacterium]
MSNSIRFAIVGFGYIGKRHAEHIQNHPEAELVGVADINQQLSVIAQEQFHVAFFSSLDELLEATPQIDVVNVCTPNGLHVSHCLRALQYPAHVVCEKPLGLTTDSCLQVIELAKQQNKEVFCVIQNRYSPPAAWLKEIISQQILGDIYHVQISCYWNRDTRYYLPGSWKGTQNLDGGTLFTQFSHFIDLMLWVFGDITNVQANFHNHSHKDLIAFEDTGSIVFDFVNGGSGNLTYSTSVWNKNFESSITVIAEKGTVKIGGQYMDKLEYCHIKDYPEPILPPSNPPNDYGGYQGSASNHSYVIQNVIDTLKGRSCAAANALDGLRVVNVIERIYQLKPKKLIAT